MYCGGDECFGDGGVIIGFVNEFYWFGGVVWDDVFYVLWIWLEDIFFWFMCVGVVRYCLWVWWYNRYFFCYVVLVWFFVWDC